MLKKSRISRIPFCEWRSESFGSRNIGGIICGNCNFSRTLRIGEKHDNYKLNNKIDRPYNCPACESNDWYWLPPIARVPKKKCFQIKMVYILEKLKRKKI